MNTYELLTAAGHILGDIEDENGEITEATLAGMDEWIDAAEDKLGRIRAVITRTKNEQALLREEEKRLADRRKRLNDVLDRVTDLATSLLQAQEALGHDNKVKTDTYSVWLHTTKRAELADGFTIYDVPEELRNYGKPALNRTAVKEAESKGDLPPGTVIQDHQILRWK